MDEQAAAARKPDPPAPRKRRNGGDDVLAGTRTIDRARLIGLRAAARKDATRQAAFAKALAASRAAVIARRESAPVPQFDDELPIAREAERIVELIRAHPVVVIAGETGSGKTTQLPKLCLAAGRGAMGMIGCTQPRRIAARSVARRVAQELNVTLGGAVGFQVRFNDQVGPDTRIKFMTDGILLAEMQSDRWLSSYDTLIIDEAHERSLNIDFLLGYLRALVDRRPDLKVIVTSATIDTARFARHFHDAPVLAVEGRSYPVEVRYRPLEIPSGDDDRVAERAPAREPPSRDPPSGEPSSREPRSVSAGIVSALEEITREDAHGDVLVFLPGEREIRDLHQILGKRLASSNAFRHTAVLPLYARLSPKDQDRVFNPGPGRRIVLATNVAETSLTVPRIRYVIDPGLARIKRYSPRMKLDRLRVEAISQASADQRKGRCGRVAAGVCYRLYAQADYESRPRYTDPEILRASLAGVILRMLALGLGRVEDFAFIDAPDGRAIADGWQQLWELGAVSVADAHGRRTLTAIGRTLARIPVDVKLARILIAAKQHDCLRAATIIASFLSVQDPRERPPEARGAADAAHAAFADPRSEFVGIVNLWDAYAKASEDLTQSKLRDWCERHFLGFLRMREWRELHRQLVLVCDELDERGPPLRVDQNASSTRPARDPEKSAEAWSAAAYAALHRALIAGLPMQIGNKDEKHVYAAPRQRRFKLFPGSTLARQPPPWVLSATLLDTTQAWGLINARIEPDWAIAELPHLLARKHFDPRWSRAQGRVLASEQISLFGLVLAPKRPVHYGSIALAEAREIFIRQGLVTGEIDLRAPFLKRNLATLDKAREEEAKLRRAGLVADEDWQARWYLDRIPSDICTQQGIEAWYGKASPEARRALEWPLLELLPGEGSEADRFPKYLALGDARLPLHYHFEPGAEDDGVSLLVPLHLLRALDGARLSWLVPGLHEEKATALIRGLPKTLRRNYVPAPDFARAFAQAWPAASADSLPGELARFLSRATGAVIAATDFDEVALDPHLRMNLRVLDAGRVLAQSRDLDALRTELGARADAAFAARSGRELAVEGLREFPALPIPECVPGEAGVIAYPALVDGDDCVALRMFADAAQARREHVGGVRRLLRIALAERIKSARKQLPIGAQIGLLYAAIEKFSGPASGKSAAQEHLRTDIVEAALNALLADGMAAIRDRAAFTTRAEAIGRGLFAEAMTRLQLASAILEAVAALKPKLDAPLLGWARGNLDDLRAQLDALLPPGFLHGTPPAALAQFPRYLKAMALRARRAIDDPPRDQARMLELRPFVDALAEARARGVLDTPGWLALRWDLEELRVSIFAQELGAQAGISIKRLTRQLAELRTAST
ncbi:MAG: ATP-dependent RNA helicase HrpA [Proteobacteria bacterium]|nr:ATP-dependent RNA helicase HrpA [Pseudomonadota bacterium]